MIDWKALQGPAIREEFWRLHNWEPDTIVEVASVDTFLPSWDTDEHDAVHTAYGYTDAIGPDRIWFTWETCEDHEHPVQSVPYTNALDASADWRRDVTAYLLGCREVEAALAQVTPSYLDKAVHAAIQRAVRAAQVALYSALTGIPEVDAEAEVQGTTGYRPKDSQATERVVSITEWDAGSGHAHAYHHLLSLGDE